MAKQVRVILDENKAERHIRGGMATKMKYSHLNEEKRIWFYIKFSFRYYRKIVLLYYYNINY